jgi:hypothetical protein
VAQTIVVCRLRAVRELGGPRKTMACPTANLLYSYFLDTALGCFSSGVRHSVFTRLH